MKLLLPLLAALCGLTLTGRAASLPPEKLLPPDTLGVITVPDWDRASAAMRDSSAGQLWRDPAMKPFLDKFTAKWSEEVVVPLERELGIKFADYGELLHGQLTLAVTQSGWAGKTDPLPGVVLLLDARDKADALKKVVADLRKKWVDSGKQIKTEKIRDVEFTTLILTGDDLRKSLEKAYPKLKGEADAEKKSGGKVELAIGQSGSLLLVGTQPKDFEQILARQSGGLASSLAEQPGFQADQSACFRDSIFYLWVNFKPLIDALKAQINSSPAGQGENPLGLKPEKIIDAVGVNGLKSLAIGFNQSSEGTLAQIFIGLPESGRKGLFKIVVPDAKESGPPPFVPAEVVKFGRWRFDTQRIWATLKGLVNELSPQLSGLMTMTLEAAGKDRDPNFSLERQIIGNLGGDFIKFDRAPLSAKAEDLQSPPSLMLIGSPSPDQLIAAVKTVAGGGEGEGGFKEREFLGRKVYSVALPGLPGLGSGGRNNLISFASSGGYVVVSADVAMLEDYLRSGENQRKPLRELPGLAEAAQKVGGLSTGWFGYENQTATLKLVLEALRTDPGAFERMLSLGGLPAGAIKGPDLKQVRDWFDFALLPSFDKLAKYFHYTVTAGSANAEGVSFKAFGPTPPQMKR